MNCDNKKSRCKFGLEILNTSPMNCANQDKEIYLIGNINSVKPIKIMMEDKCNDVKLTTSTFPSS